MKSIAKKTIKTPIGIDNGYTNEYQGEHESTLELWQGDTYFQIEWDIPSLEETEHINILVEVGTKKVEGYDGIFEVPKEIIVFLEENGFDCGYLRNLED